MSRWYRSYADKHRNPKVATLSDREFRLWDQLLCIAVENRGKIPPLKQLKLVLRLRHDHLSRGIERLVEQGLINPVDEGYLPHNWKERQYASNTDEAKWYTYFIAPPNLEQVKIGYSKNPWARVAGLQTGHHQDLSVVAVIPTSESGDRWLIDLFQDCNARGEWFVPNAKMRSLIKALRAKEVASKDEVINYVANYVVATTITDTDTDTDTDKPDKSGSPARAGAREGDHDFFGDEPPVGGNAKEDDLGKQYTAAFEHWWALYPNKVGKGKAASAYEQAFKNVGGASKGVARVHAYLFRALTAQIHLWKQKRVEGKFIPHASTWLSQARYEDDPVKKLLSTPAVPQVQTVDAELRPATPRPAKRETLSISAKPRKPVGWTPDGE